MRHLISILLQNEAGALARVAGLFAARGYNIESLTVAATHDADASRLSLTIFGDDTVVEQIIKQSRKLVDVLEIVELTRATSWRYASNNTAPGCSTAATRASSSNTPAAPRMSTASSMPWARLPTYATTPAAASPRSSSACHSPCRNRAHNGHLTTRW